MITNEMLRVMEEILNPEKSIDHNESQDLEDAQESDDPIGSFSRWRLAKKLQVGQRMVVGLVEKMDCLVREEKKRSGAGGRGKDEYYYHVDREGIVSTPSRCYGCIYQFWNYHPCVSARNGIKFDPPSELDAPADAPEE